MSAAIWFWIIYVISLVFGGGWYWRNQQTLISFGPFSLLFFVLIGLLGWGCIRGANSMMPVPEPAGDIEAQLRAALDPDHPKRCMFAVPADVHVIPRTIDAYIIDRPEGTLVTLHKRLADAFERSADDTTMAWLLGYPEPKPVVVERCHGRPAIEARALQARDRDGHVVTEAFASPLGFFETVEAIERHVPEDGRLVILSPVLAIMRRVAMRWVERNE